MVNFADYIDEGNVAGSEGSDAAPVFRHLRRRFASFRAGMSFLVDLMQHPHWRKTGATSALVAACLLALSGGCHAIDFYTPSLASAPSPDLDLPRELSKVTLPDYRIEPPDLIRLEVLKLVPRPSYRIDRYDVLQIRVYGTILGQPIDDYFLVEQDGLVSLGPAYGVVRVAGMTMNEAAAAITQSLKLFLKNPSVTVQLSRSADARDISKIYPVGSDGAITIGRFGSIHLAGKTLVEARRAIEEHLRQFFDGPVVGVEMIDFASKHYYVVVAGAFKGETIRRYTITGNETVLDAVSQLTSGLPRVSSKTMWVARATPDNCEQMLPVDWNAIARGGDTKTNYQLMPGDRLYIVDDSLVAANNYLNRLVSPVERLLGITGLGIRAVNSTETTGRAYNQTRN